MAKSERLPGETTAVTSETGTSPSESSGLTGSSHSLTMKLLRGYISIQLEYDGAQTMCEAGPADYIAALSNYDLGL